MNRLFIVRLSVWGTDIFEEVPLAGCVMQTRVWADVPNTREAIGLLQDAGYEVHVAYSGVGRRFRVTGGVQPLQEV